MSHRFWSLVRQASQLRIFRSYVGTAEEVKEYHRGKKRALQWLTGFEPRPRRRNPSDHVAIHYAFNHHLFDPLKHIPPPPAPPILPVEQSVAALEVCGQMLRDLEPYMTARNVVKCAERLAQILAYSEKEIWAQRHSDCIAHLGQLIQIAMPRCNRSDLGILVWSIGKCGPKSLTLSLQEDVSVKDLVLRLMDRVCEDGVKGELDNDVICNVLNGCIQLKLNPSRMFLRSMSRTLYGSIEFADGRLLTRFVLSCAQLNLPMEAELLQKLANTAEVKIRAGNYADKEIPLMIWALGQWQRGGSPMFLKLTDAVEAHLVQQKAEWTLRQYVLVLEGLVHLRHFPSWPLLELIDTQARKESPASNLWITFLKIFAELGVRSAFVLRHGAELLDGLDDEDNSLTASDVCLLLRSMSLLYALTADHFASGIRFISRRQMELTHEDKTCFYLAYLHFKYCIDESDLESVDPELLRWCRDSWRAEEDVHMRRHHSKFRILQHDIRKQSKLTASYQTTANGDLRIFVLQAKTGSSHVVDIDPDVFLNVPGRITGSQLWRKQLLKKLGWTVLDIDPSLFANPKLLQSWLMNQLKQLS